jgi:hypothetical protein
LGRFGWAEAGVGGGSLNSIIKTEIKNLAHEMEGKFLSKKAKQYISQELKRLGMKNINVVVEKEVADERQG